MEKNIIQQEKNSSAFLFKINQKLKNFFNEKWNVFLTIIFFLLTFYYSFYFFDKFSNLRLFYNNSDTATFVSVAEKKSGSIKLKTRHPKKITFVYSAINNEDLSPKDFDIEFAGIPANLLNSETVFFEDEYFLIINLPSFGINIKDKVLNFSIQSDKALIKYNQDGTIVHKQGGAMVLLQAASVILIFLVSLLFFLLIFKTDKWKVENKFLFFSLAIGLFLIFSRPPCSQYDDLIHFDSVYNMSNMMLGMEDARKTKTLPKRACDLDLLPGYYPDKYFSLYWAWLSTPKDYFKHFISNFNKKTNTELENSLADKVVKPQRAYFFSAVAVTLARLLHLNQFTLYYFGAIINLLIAVFLIYFSSKKNIYLKNNVMIILAMFPIALLEFGSYSYDAILIATAFALINYSIYFFYSEKKQLKDFIIIIALCLFVFPIKTVYFPLSFYLLMTLFFQKYKNFFNKNKIWICLSLVALYVAAYFLSLLPQIKFLHSKYPSQINSGVFTFSIADVIQHPLYTIMLQINTFMESSHNQLTDFFFFASTWKYYLPFTKYLFYFLCLVLFFIEKNNVKEFTMPSVIVFSLVSIFIILVGMTWTPLNLKTMWGVQLRYFLPVLPCAFIAAEKLKSDKIAVKFSNAFNLTLILTFFSTIDLVLEIGAHSA